MSRSVLVVDDDASFRHLAAGLVRSWGHDVVGEAGTVAEALERANALHPEAMLIDVGLPDGDGLRLTTWMCRLAWKPLILLISSDADAATDAEARRAGAAAFIPKSDISDGELRELLDV